MIYPYQSTETESFSVLLPHQTYFIRYSIYYLLGAPLQGRATKNWSIDSLWCSPPRKSLVKGERFMRDEGKPELDYDGEHWDHISLKIISHMGQTAF